MEALFDFFITIIKVYIVSYLYVKLYSIITNKFGNLKFISTLPKIKNRTYFKIIRLTIFFALILFSFTYWGNKGYGDEILIPIGYNKHVGQIDGNQAYIAPEGQIYGTLNIEDFQICNNLVFGESVSSPVDTPPPYFVWDFKTEEFTFFENKIDFENFIKQKNILK